MGKKTVNTTRNNINTLQDFVRVVETRILGCHNYQWGDNLARWLGETAKARSIYFEYSSSCHRGAVHDTEFIISNISSYRLRGMRFTKIFIDNGVYSYHKLTPRLKDELQLIKQRTVSSDWPELEAGPYEREEY